MYDRIDGYPAGRTDKLGFLTATLSFLHLPGRGPPSSAHLASHLAQFSISFIFLIFAGHFALSCSAFEKLLETGAARDVIFEEFNSGAFNS